MKKLHLLASLPTALLILSSFVTPSMAQTNKNVTKVSISPVTFNLTANPGDTLTEVFKVRNDGTDDQFITIETQNFKTVDEEGDVGLTNDNGTYALAKWVSFDHSSFNLKSGQEQLVHYTIRVPFNAEPGGHYASVYAHIGAQPGESSGAAVNQKVGSLVLLRVAGNVKEAATIDSFVVGDIKPGKPVDFNVRVDNQGSVHLKPKGLIAITDMFGKKVADVEVEQKNVFPGSIRRLGATWSKPPFIGRYTASLLMYYGTGNQQLTASTTFWIIPWKTLGIAGGIALAVIVLLWLARKRVGKAVKALVGK